MRVLTWNVWGRFGDWPTRQFGIYHTLALLDPDVIALQETWRAGDEPSQAARLAEQLNHYHVDAHPHLYAGEGRGLAVLSRWPIRNHDSYPLPDGGAPTEHRLALHVDISTPDGTLPLWNTHLNWRPDHSYVRQAQVRALLEHIAKDGRSWLPPVLCGDFNARPTADEIRMLTGLSAVPVPGLVFQDAWDIAGDGGAGHTWSHANPEAAKERHGNARVDYVLVGWEPGRHGRILHAQVVEGQRPRQVWPSDHFALLAHLDLSSDNNPDLG